MVADQGYSAGGPPPYGLQRLLLDEQREPLHVLEPGQRKGIQNQRVTLMPGEPERVELIRRIFQEFVELGHSEYRIPARRDQGCQRHFARLARSSNHAFRFATRRERPGHPAEGDAKGEQFMGIYELDEKTRKLRFIQKERERPTEFTSTPGSERILVTFQREPDE